MQKIISTLLKHVLGKNPGPLLDVLPTFLKASYDDGKMDILTKL